MGAHSFCDLGKNGGGDWTLVSFRGESVNRKKSGKTNGPPELERVHASFSLGLLFALQSRSICEGTRSVLDAVTADISTRSRHAVPCTRVSYLTTCPVSFDKNSNSNFQILGMYVPVRGRSPNVRIATFPAASRRLEASTHFPLAVFVSLCVFESLFISLSVPDRPWLSFFAPVWLYSRLRSLWSVHVCVSLCLSRS